MAKFRKYALVAASLLVAVPALQAQSGCFHSPEAPTDVLLLVGSVGMFYGSSALRKLVARRRNRS